MHDVFRRGIGVLALLTSLSLSASEFKNQQQLDEFAKLSTLKFGLDSNFLASASQFQAHLTLQNKSAQALSRGLGNWQIYFHSIRKLTNVTQQGLTLEHVQGDLHRLRPTADFKGLAKGESLTFQFIGAPWIVSYSDFMPRAFISAGSLNPAVFANTDTEQLTDFIEPLVKPEQTLRYQQPQPDLFAIRDSQSRYHDNLRVNQQPLQQQQALDRIIPTPKQLQYQAGRVNFSSDWQIQFQGRLTPEANYLQQQLQQSGLTLAFATAPGQKQRLILAIDAKQTTPESYQLRIAAEQIEISGADQAGVFYGIQSLLSLLPAHYNSAGNNKNNGVSLPKLVLSDAPRFHWRGMHYDMGRNFHGKAVTLRLIEQMARVKMNKLHLHLTEDEGWRLQIPGLPELTDIGAHRCFDLTEQKCLLTQLGTGPHRSGSGNGYYSSSDFVEILQYAAARHIEVIPEIDMPGHARAAIKAMEARYKRLMREGQPDEAKRYLLSDPADKSQYLTVQSYTDNAVNVCLDSSYAFIDKVIYELQQMYRQAGLRLTRYHMGGDETASGSWQQSPACQALFAKGQPGLAGVADLKPYFVSRVAEMLDQRQLALGGWEDGLMYDANTPFNRAQFKTPQVFANVWDNIWEWGVADRAYRLANAGYQVVLSHGTHLYLDHPNEAHPAERGYYWAARYTDARKIYSYMPDQLYANADKTRDGQPIVDLEQLLGRELPALTQPQNILGMQGQIWTETIRTAQQLEQMLYPRLQIIAERAWHQASWEKAKPDVAQRDNEWSLFAQSLSLKLLPKLAASGSDFYLPPSGAVREQGQLKANVAYPGLTLEYSLDQGASWQQYRDKEPVKLDAQPVWLRSKASSGAVSRITVLP